MILQLDLQLQDETGGDISSFVTNGEWDLLGLLMKSTFKLFLFNIQHARVRAESITKASHFRLPFFCNEKFFLYRSRPDGKDLIIYQRGSSAKREGNRRMNSPNAFGYCFNYVFIRNKREIESVEFLCTTQASRFDSPGIFSNSFSVGIIYSSHFFFASLFWP